MAHETLVHRADAQLAAGAEPEPVIEAEIAADAIDEWLMLLTGGLGHSDERTKALTAGAGLHIHATDDGLGGRGEWMIRHDGGSLTVEPAHGKGDAVLTGPAASFCSCCAAKAGFRSGSDRLRGQRRGGWLAGKHRVLTTGLSSAADPAQCRPHATGSTGADYDPSALFADPEAAGLGHHADRGGDAPAAGPSGVRMGSRSSQVSDTGGRAGHQGRIAAARRDPGWARRPRCPQADRQRPARLVTAPRAHAASVRRAQGQQPTRRSLAGLE